MKIQNRKTFRLLSLTLLSFILFACEEKTVDFSYSPTEPKAGESVQFSNLSNTGEEWEWTFGDGSKATNKMPTHTYKQPGKYVVQLKVDNNKSLMVSKEITIYDTIPNYSSTIVDSVGTDIFEEETFEALVYNPYSYTLTYQWSIEGCEYTQTSDTSNQSTYSVRFTKKGEATVQLIVVLNGDSTIVRHTYTVNDVPTRSLLMQDNQGNNYRQRIFDSQHEDVSALLYTEGIDLLQNAQDTMQVYNNKEFRISDLVAKGYAIEGFAISARKVYFRAGGLYVGNLDGQHIVEIDANPVYALCIDELDNRIYWAREKKVMYMPLVGSNNNRFTTTPQEANNKEHITKMVIDGINR